MVTDWLSSNRTLFMYIVAAAMLLLTAVAAFASPAGAWPLAICAAVCVFLANLEQFTEVSATTTGFSAKLRQANETLDAIETNVELIAEVQLALFQRMGRWGGPTHEERQRYLERTMEMLRAANVPPERISEIKATVWDPYVRFDYVSSILGGSRTPQGKPPTELRERWAELRKFERQPTAEELRQLIADFRDSSPERLALVDAYEHYVEHGVHKDITLWNKHDQVPALEYHAPD